MPSRRSCEVQNNCYIKLVQPSNFLFRQERYFHAAVVVDGEDQIIIIGGSSSSKTTGEIVKSKYP